MSAGSLGTTDKRLLLVAISIDLPGKHARSARAFLLSDGIHDELVDLANPDLHQAHRLRDTNNVVLFADAKTSMREWLNAGIDIARPLCLKTLQSLLALTQTPPDNWLARTQYEASSLIPKMLDQLEELLVLVEQHNLRKLARLESLVLRPFAALEHQGLYVDSKQWRALIESSRHKMAHAKDEALTHLAISQSVDLFGDCTINLDRGAEIKDALEKITGQVLHDTREQTLSRLNHPAADAIVRYREAAKLVQTYGDNFLSFVDPLTSRIHATFDPIGTSTGRVSCHSPNLQNLPSGDDFHRCIVAPENKSLITADYAACELRILAAFAQDTAFLDAFNRDIDVHSEVASKMFGVAVDKSSHPHLRQRAKAINFGLMYGMGPKSLARSLEISDAEAENLFEQYFKTYPGIKAYLDNCVDRALNQGFAETVLGRRLYFDEETLKGSSARGELSRIAKNMPIQGTGAEITKLAMLRIHERLTAEFSEAHLVNMIHDEIVVECLDKDASEIAQLVQDEMESAQASLIPNVKPKAQVHTGKFWHH